MGGSFRNLYRGKGEAKEDEESNIRAGLDPRIKSM